MPLKRETPILVSQQYPELLHYTTLDGLRGILTSGCLWATDAAFLNDSSEIKHFFEVRLRELILPVARKYAVEMAGTPAYLARMIEDGGIDRFAEMEADRWQATLSHVTFSMNRPFVLSLSGPSDRRVQHSGLLSQWRGYGSDGGYALIFDTKKLETMLTDEAHAHHYMLVQIGDVYYHGIDPLIQLATPDVENYEAIVCEGVRRMLRGGTADETDRFYEAVTSLSCLYKHWGFWEEREIRVVVVPASDEVAKAGEPAAPPQKKVKLFARGDKRLPYVELFAAGPVADANARLPINRVIVGPHRNSHVHAESVRQMLSNAGYSVEVVQSEIPYIGR